MEMIKEIIFKVHTTIYKPNTENNNINFLMFFEIDIER